MKSISLFILVVALFFYVPSTQANAAESRPQEKIAQQGPGPQGPVQGQQEAAPKSPSQGQQAGEASAPGEPRYVAAGEFFGIRVPVSNYYVVKGALLVFGNKWGPQPATPEELEGCVWTDLVLSYEAFRRTVTVTQEELDEEIAKIVKDEKVAFDWKKDKDAYKKWVKDKTTEPVDLFENQLRHLIQIKKLREQVMEGIHPTVTDEEAFQEYLDEYNTLGIELVQLDDLKAAEEFCKKAKAEPKFWDEERGKRPKDFRRPGFVSLEFLMAMWKLPRDAAYKMMKMEIGDIYPPAPIYKGYGVFKVLEKRPADESKYPAQKDFYHKKIEMRKKYEEMQEWVKKLKEEAEIKVNPDLSKIEKEEAEKIDAVIKEAEKKEAMKKQAEEKEIARPARPLAGAPSTK